VVCDSSIFAVDESAVAQALSASEVAQVEVPVVTPHKALKSAPIVKHGFLLNLKVQECKGFEDKKGAEHFKGIVVHHDSKMRLQLLTAQLVDVSAARKFMAVC
jgi:hypothetical protein